MRHPVRPAFAGLLLAAALVLTGCGAHATSDSSSSAGDAKAGANSAAKEAAGSAGAKDGGSGADRTAPDLTVTRIIRTASLTVQVKDVPKALDAARTTAEDAGGYVGDETTTRDSGGRERTRVVLRVPAGKYDQVLGDLQGAGKLIERTAKAQDVTDQVVDVDSRVRSQRASVARIRELMDRAAKLSDVVTLEGELSSREADLESLLAQQASLKDRTSMATITLSLTPTPVHRAAKDDSPGFVDAVSGGWHVFVTMLRWIVLALGAALPFAVLAAVAALLWWKLLRRRRSPAQPGSET
ncbi:DUF4349 domain-containing protein [Streptomyces sp. Ag109_O5-10]|uniref:DUF4349 domain-containing protein n=1 Tax=Streptomyces sp. Ag109_O5-10 TaxID=1855349 RepID=UPI000895F165|nr:DUF4349 domain-containing protein [Streptomyces sp. Ag109_O5-10]SEE36633.1 protein of unknown function [Streptomyces sp. Ag109_O5-10]